MQTARPEPVKRRVPPPMPSEPIVAGPFACNNRKENISLRFYIRHLGRDEMPSKFYSVRREYDIAYARGVVHAAMEALWGDKTHLEFKCNGNVWRIENIRVDARHAENPN